MVVILDIMDILRRHRMGTDFLTTVLRHMVLMVSRLMDHLMDRHRIFKIAIMVLSLEMERKWMRKRKLKR